MNFPPEGAVGHELATQNQGGSPSLGNGGSEAPRFVLEWCLRALVVFLYSILFFDLFSLR